jgi:hypothetical protein
MTAEQALDALDDRLRNNLVREYRAALLATRSADFAPLLGAGISRGVIAALGVAAVRITVSDTTFEPHPDGAAAYILPVRVEQPIGPEAADPATAVHEGEIVDLLAFHPAFPLRWALRRDATDWLGAIEPQYLDPMPIPVWRSPLNWLRAGCVGLVVLSPRPAEAWRILSGCVGGLVAEDKRHAAELRAALVRPWPVPPIIFPAQSRAA